MIRISFIIPCYNGEKFIAACLDSIFAQGMLMTEFEVICIDDASPDKMHKVVEAYMCKFNNIKYVRQNQNQGQGESRNVGLTIARGNYVWFVDNDDLIRENCLSEALYLCEINKLDALMFNFSRAGKVPRFLNSFNVISGPELIKNWLSTNESNKYESFFCIWTYIFNRNFLLKNDIRFRKNQRILEDVAFSYKVLCLADAIQLLPKVNYYFGDNNFSSSRTRLNAKKLYDGYFGIVHSLLHLSDLVIERDVEICRRLLIPDAIYHFSQIKFKFCRLSKVEKFKLIKLFRDNHLEIVDIIDKLSVFEKQQFFYLKHPLLLFLFLFCEFFWRIFLFLTRK